MRDLLSGILRGRLLRGSLLRGVMVADGAPGRSARRAVSARHMSGDAADDRALDAAFRLRRRNADPDQRTHRNASENSFHHHPPEADVTGQENETFRLQWSKAGCVSRGS
jgi:hypothetical protein